VDAGCDLRSFVLYRVRDLNVYYQEFSIPLWLLDLPAYTYPISAQKFIVWLLLVILALVPLVSLLERWYGWLYAHKGRPRPKAEPVTILTVFGFAGLMLFAIAIFAYQSGTSKAQGYIQNNSAVATLAFKSATPPYPRDEKLLRANQAGTLRILTQTKDLVIVYEKTPDEKLTTYVVARSELSSVRASGIQWHP
jgi:hypothetical protein